MLRTWNERHETPGGGFRPSDQPAGACAVWRSNTEAVRSPWRSVAPGRRRIGRRVPLAAARAAVPPDLRPRWHWGAAEWAALRSDELRRLADATGGVGRAEAASTW